MSAGGMPGIGAFGHLASHCFSVAQLGTIIILGGIRGRGAGRIVLTINLSTARRPLSVLLGVHGLLQISQSPAPTPSPTAAATVVIRRTRRR